MNKLIKALAVGAGSLAGLAGLGIAGMQVPPPAFPPIPSAPGGFRTVPIPGGLPAPVDRYLRAIGDGRSLPLLDSFVMWGRMRMKRGMWMHGRWRAYHIPGQHFHRPLEITWFGLPFLRGTDQSIDGQGTMMVGDERTMDDETSQGAMAILWLEAACSAGLYVTDRRLRWEALDEHKARMVYPTLQGEDLLVYDFDPETGLPARVSTMRYKRAGEPKYPWHSDLTEWRHFETGLAPAKISVTWEDEGEPWSYWATEGIATNVDVSPQIEAGRAINRGA
jgi:hypothetical protein